MENQLSSSGIFSQELHHCRFFRRSRVICEKGILNLKILEIGLSFYLLSAPMIGQEKETKRSVFQIQKKTRCTRRDSRKDIGRFLALETKSNGMETAVTNLKENDIPSLQRWYSDSRKQVTGSLRASQGWKEKKPYISIGCFEHRTFIPKHPLGRSAQKIRSSLKLEWTARSKSERDWAYLGKVHVKKRVRESRNTEERAFIGSKLFGRFFKVGTCVGKQNAKESSELCVTTQIQFNVRKFASQHQSGTQ